MLSTIHRLRDQWRAWRRGETEEKKKEGGRADLRWLQPLVVLLGTTGSSTGGLQWFFSLFLSVLLLSLCCPLFFFSLFFYLFVLFFLLSFLSYILPSVPLVSPVFIGENKGETWLGRTLCCCPTTARGGTSPPFIQHVGGHGSAQHK